MTEPQLIGLTMILVTLAGSLAGSAVFYLRRHKRNQDDFEDVLNQFRKGRLNG